MAVTVRMSSKNQIVVPREVREALRLRPGSELIVAVEQGRAVLWPKPKDYVAALRGLGKEIWRGVDPVEYIRRERASWKRREKRLGV